MHWLGVYAVANEIQYLSGRITPGKFRAFTVAMPGTNLSPPAQAISA
jgi:hypothetical protein